MINVTIGESKTQSCGYPKVMISSLAKTVKGTIVFFISDCKGVCLQKGKGEWSDVGDYCEDWNMDAFTIFTEPITLQNA